MKRQFVIATVMVAIMVLSILIVPPVMSGLGAEKMNDGQTSAPDRSCVYYDITGDAINDVLVRVTTFDPEGMPTTDIIALNGSNGSKPLWNNISFENCYADTHPAGDLNGDNKPDVVIVLESCVDLISRTSYGKVIGVNGYNGDELWNVTKTGDTGVEVALIGTPANLTSANRTDVVVSTITSPSYRPRTNIMAINGSDDGAELWNKSFNGIVFGVPVDLINDGKDEVVIGMPEEMATSLAEGIPAKAYNVTAIYGNNGTRIWSKGYPDVATFDPAGDLTGDGKNDLMVWIGCCKLEALRGDNGTELWNVSV